MKRTATTTIEHLPDGTEVATTEWNSGCLWALGRWWPILVGRLTVRAIVRVLGLLARGCWIIAVALWRASVLALRSVLRGGAK